VSENKPLILFVEDDIELAEMLVAFFSAQNYKIHSVDCGEDAAEYCKNHTPDLVILDIRLPDIDGYEVAHRLRTSRRTKDVPIIFLTEKRTRSERLHGLELGADDYVTKPFDIHELRLRVRNALHRTVTGPLNNPVTALPEGMLVDERLCECLGKEGWATLLVRLENLESFRESYGFVASDDVMRAISLMVRNAVRDLGNPNDFVGQIAPTSILVVTQPHSLPELSERIRTRLEQAMDYFYPLKDRDLKEFQARRLSVRLSQLSAGQGHFPDLPSLKNKILHARGKV
jgi:CheY-like chemotaxis protein